MFCVWRVGVLRIFVSIPFVVVCRLGGAFDLGVRWRDVLFVLVSNFGSCLVPYLVVMMVMIMVMMMIE